MRRAEPVLVALAALVALWIGTAALATPFWWDAGAVYAPGAKWIVDHGLDARPGVFPDDLSRGHPPLYFLVLALAFRLDRAGPVAAHAISLVSGWAAVVATYAIAREIWGRSAAVIAAALIASAPLFLTMSSQALPEALITALTAAAFLAFARGKIVACAVLGSILVLVKETGLACPVAMAGAIAVDRLRGGGRLRDEARSIAILMVPAAVLAAFFLYQRAVTGWFITPYHAALFHEDHPLLPQLARVVRSIALADGRWIAVLAALALLALGVRSPRPASPARPRVLIAFALDALLNVAFFTKSFYLDRYTLPLHVCVAVTLAGVLAGSAGRARIVGIAAAALAVIVALSRRDAGEDLASGETSFRYLHAVHAYSAMYRRVEAAGGDPTLLTVWPVTDALRRPFLGWVDRPLHALDVDQSPPGAPFDRVLAVPGLGSYPRLVARARAAGFHRLDVSRDGPASIELWGP